MNIFFFLLFLTCFLFWRRNDGNLFFFSFDFFLFSLVFSYVFSLVSRYFGYKQGPCDRKIQHAACELLETEIECNLNHACRSNKDPWYMDAIIETNPLETSSGFKQLEYIGKCMREGEPKNITATTCGMTQMDYCGNGKGPGMNSSCSLFSLFSFVVLCFLFFFLTMLIFIFFIFFSFFFHFFFIFFLFFPFLFSSISISICIFIFSKKVPNILII